MHLSLIKSNIDKLKPDPSGMYIVRDPDLKGFHLRVYPNGRMVYFVYYRNEAGQERRPKIGEHGTITADKARGRAKEILSAATLGGDPSGEEKQKRLETKRAVTFADFAEDYMRNAAWRNKASTVKENQRRLNRFVLPALGKLKVKDITRGQVYTLIQRIKNGETPAQKDKPASYIQPANHTLALLKKMFHEAEIQEIIPAGSNPCKLLKKDPVKGRERFLKTDELARLGEALSGAEVQGESPWAIAAIRLLLFLGARKQEILTLRWEYINLEAGTIRLPDSKTGAKTLYLNEPAAEVIKRLYQLRSPESPWVVQSTRPRRHLVDLQGYWRKILERAGIDKVRVHDLRHTAASVAAMSGLGLPVIGALLGHQRAETTKKYAHMAESPLTAASQLVGEKLSEALAGGAAKVIDMAPATDPGEATGEE